MLEMILRRRNEELAKWYEEKGERIVEKLNGVRSFVAVSPARPGANYKPTDSAQLLPGNDLELFVVGPIALTFVSLRYLQDLEKGQLGSGRHNFARI